MIIKLMGMGKDAQAIPEVDAKAALAKYSDAEDLSAWSRKNVAKLVLSGILNGFPDYTIKPQDDMTGNQYAALLLRTLGYSESQYKFQNSAADLSKLADGFASIEDSPSLAINRNTAVEMTFGILDLQISDKSYTVIDKLVSLGAVDVAAAKKYGLVTKVPEESKPTPTPSPTPIYVPYYPPADTAVSFSSVELSSLTDTTTQLKLTFSADPTTLSINDITVTGATKGELSGTGNTRTLTVSDITVSKLENIKVKISNPSGYSISPSECSVSTSNLLSFTVGAPATIGTQLTVSAGSLALDNSLTYNWYQSDNNTLLIGEGSTDSMAPGSNGAICEPGETCAGKYLIARADYNYKGKYLLVATLATDKKLGSKIPDDITFSSSTTASISLTDFPENFSGFEVAVAPNGTHYGDYQALSADSSGSLVITGLSGVSGATKFKIRMKETDTAYAGPAHEFAVMDS